MTRKHPTPTNEDQPTTDDAYDLQASTPLVELDKVAAKHAAPPSLSAELAALPPVAGLDAIQANAAAGYYTCAPAGHLLADLATLNYETDEHRALLAAIIDRHKKAFSAAKH
jgi:hypothetical protein